MTYIKQTFQNDITVLKAEHLQYIENGIVALNNEKLDADALDDAIDTALAQAKASGEFKGDTGADGAPGEDGVSPTVAVESISGGHRVTITDGNGAQSFDVLDGADGSGGDGSGDMLKSTYDSNNSGVVDDAEKLGGKTPDKYASADHTHEEYADADHAHDVFSAGEAGFVPAPTAADSEKFLRGDGSWATVESGGSVGFTRTLLWENPNPDVGMDVDTLINLSSSDYDELVVYYRQLASGTMLHSARVLKGSYVWMFTMRYPSAGLQVSYRNLSYISDTQYKQGTAYGFNAKGTSLTTDEAKVLLTPYKIYGIKY